MPSKRNGRSRGPSSSSGARSSREAGGGEGGQRRTWTEREVRYLKQLALENTPTRVMGLKLMRTPGAIYAKASAIGLSLKPTNQSPFG